MIGLENYAKLLEAKVIDFVIDNVGYGLKEKGGHNNMIIGRFEPGFLTNEDKDIEKNIREIVKSRRRC